MHKLWLLLLPSAFLTLLPKTPVPVAGYTVVFGQLGKLAQTHQPFQERKTRVEHPVADLAQLKSQSPLCLLQAESSLASNGLQVCHLDLQRVPRFHAEKASIGKLHNTGAIVDLSSILRGPDSNEPTVSPSTEFRSLPVPAKITASTAPPRGQQQQQQQPAPQTLSHGSRPIAPASRPGGRRSMPSSGPDQPAKKQSKWSPEEDALIIELRGSGMKWEDISKHLPGRSAISCRLHYQNYLERRSEWSEERKDKLAQLYERYVIPLCTYQRILPYLE